MNRKIFSERFNRELALMGFPSDPADKIQAIMKAFHVTSYLANGMVFGHIAPSVEQLNKIASILDVAPDWLSGDTDKKKAYIVEDVS